MIKGYAGLASALPAWLQQRMRGLHGQETVYVSCYEAEPFVIRIEASNTNLVIPAEAGIQYSAMFWIPASAGMTIAFA